ncbi:hypothetical protein [Mycoavidus sp. B2-EB]|uniref:hypothetical protein n=1 Tax=Mycoavidus sp. B2-EB TaxID=2651972 RepID=UPI00162847A8|nr:hypothetical protein [Mycoavidus sp. B2-EB]BBO59167.1 hypothetical protein MPB2EB_0272 [Mycoavidus sp. B2-EB]
MKLLSRMSWLEGCRWFKCCIADERFALGGFNLLPYRYMRIRGLRQYRKYGLLSAALAIFILYDVIQTRPALHLVPNLLNSLAQESILIARPTEAAVNQPSNPLVLTQTQPLPANLALQLIGLFERGQTRAALVRSPAGSVLLRTGDELNGEVVTRIGVASLLLSNGAGLARTLSLREAN